MKLSVKALLALLVSLFAFVATGCTSKTNNDTSIPWGRPAGWEGNIPGMGSTGDTSGTR